MKRLTSIILCICLLFTAITATISVFAATDNTTVEQTVIALGIISGDQNGNLNLSQTVTRAEFSKMLVAASVYKDTVQEGSSASPFKDVKYTHWASDYIKTVVNAGWMTGYVDGTFRPDSTITFEEAASAILKLLGYEASDLTGTYPQAQISKFKSLKLNSGISVAQGQTLTRNACMYIFYNLMGTTDKTGSIYGTTLGYSMTSAGDVDYTELVKADLEGPYIIKNTTLASILPFDMNQASVYRNGKVSSADSVAYYDVVYYNTNTKTVWAYSDRIMGTYTAASPSTAAPTSITVAGNSYSLGTSGAKNKASSVGEFSIGDTVALLLGMDGDVVDILSASEVDGKYYGVITEITLSTYNVDSSTSKADYILSVACTDGVIRQCVVNSSSYSIGNVISVSYSKGQITVNYLRSSLSGTFSTDGTRFGDYTLSDNVEILDVSENGDWQVIYPSRLAGISLQSGEIHYYATNENKEITHLILDDATGDMYQYGILTSVQSSNSSATAGGLSSQSGTYQYVVNGNAGTLNTTNTIYGVSKGPAIFYYEDGQISGMKNLTSVSIDELSALTATSGSQKYKIADNVQVYVRAYSSSNDYSLTQLSAVNEKEYSLTGYYDTIYPAGGNIRVLIATKKDLS